MPGLYQRKSLGVNPYLFRWKMDTGRLGTKTPAMSGTPKTKVAQRAKREPVRPQTLHLGQWLAALNRKPVDIASAIGCTEGYLSLLISGKHKKNPSTAFMLDLSEELGISINALYAAPPSRDVAEEAGKLSPRQWAAFLEVLAMRPNREPRN